MLLDGALRNASDGESEELDLDKLKAKFRKQATAPGVKTRWTRMDVMKPGE